MNQLDALNKYKSNHLILLVGGNPLPNWVAARLLLKTRQESSNQPRSIWLLHSNDGPNIANTLGVADRLKNLLLEKIFPGADENSISALYNAKIRVEGLPSSDKKGINKRLAEIFDNNDPEGCWGVNYTGGTKPMAVHVCRFFVETFNRGSPEILFSYVDPRDRSLRIEGRIESNNREIKIFKDPELVKLTEISQNELAALHGYYPPTEKIKEDWVSGKNNPLIYRLARAIGELHSQGYAKYEQWYKWLDTCPEYLPDIKEYPDLKNIIRCMAEIAGGPNLNQPEKASNFAKALKPDAKKGFRSCHNWFAGTWLEEYALGALEEVGEKYALAHEARRNLLYKSIQNENESDNFEVDASILIGYQLFAISCTINGAISQLINVRNDRNDTAKELKEKNTSKEHLLEIYVRARQLGGDEARVGQVCFYPFPATLENEIRRSWDTEGAVKVFTIEEFANLPDAFERWFKGEIEKLSER